MRRLSALAAVSWACLFTGLSPSPAHASGPFWLTALMGPCVEYWLGNPCVEYWKGNGFADARHCLRGSGGASCTYAWMPPALAEPKGFHLARGVASKTLWEFAKQSKLDVIWDGDEVGSQRTRAVSGSLNPFRALDQMLEGSGLQYCLSSAMTVHIYARALVPTRPDDSARPKQAALAIAPEAQEPPIPALQSQTKRTLSAQPCNFACDRCWSDLRAAQIARRECPSVPNRQR